MVAGCTITVVVFILACCYRLERKWTRDSRRNEHERNNPKSEITEDNENGPSVQICQVATSKANVSEGSDTIDVVHNLVEDIGLEISSAGNDKDYKVLAQPCNNEEDVKALTRLNYDGSVDTRL